MKLMTKTLLGAAIVVTTATATLADDQIVRVYNWSDYIAEDTLEKFEAKTSIKVTYDVFDSNEVLEAKVLSGQSGYDIVVPTSDYLARHIKAGAYQKLDKSKIPNWGNLDKELLASLENYDPNNEYGVPWQWGTTGIGYNVAKIEEILGDDAPTDSWDLIFDPKYASKLEQCGISILDSSGEVLPLVLNYLGLDPNSLSTKDYQTAADKLLEIRPYITYFHSSRYISDLANGDICLSVGWSGDVFQAMARAEEADNGVEISYYIPKEGTAMWADMMAIPKDAKNVEEAHEFINFVLDAQIGADITNYVWYGSPNEAAKEFIDEEILNDPGVFPPQGTNLFTFAVLPNKVTRVMTRIWTSIKSGQ
ncbi:polyamine ABC transporter substrate-binding protein [Reinekea marina]|uniref:Putrescine-binding periplasmic protein n=1 Tax=Reinekea marina TaxID=1310421 RepID=A0ABV7WP74_9GAMM|nr:polyamine ABC transporter substrate-binding protein [Reinekea marina]MBU2864583.1 polyamine ABC transporter substrate-binding protein [Reinekea forsetii]MDN3647772.1 polyamine ABC transporter substrate-binding protein [Reinekea marina]